jgi:hypothetical protein
VAKGNYTCDATLDVGPFGGILKAQAKVTVPLVTRENCKFSVTLQAANSATAVGVKSIVSKLQQRSKVPPVARVPVLALI